MQPVERKRRRRALEPLLTVPVAPPLPSVFQEHFLFVGANSCSNPSHQLISPGCELGLTKEVWRSGAGNLYSGVIAISRKCLFPFTVSRKKEGWTFLPTEAEISLRTDFTLMRGTGAP